MASRPRLGGAIIALLVMILPFFGCEREPRPVLGMLEPDPGRNVIIVSFDALRADALGVYGYERRTSPNIDRFAEESLLFDAAYTVAPVTPTSFAAFFTGVYPTRTFRNWRFEPEHTLAEHFRAAGYRTAMIANNVQLTSERSFDRGFDDFEIITPRDDDVALEQALRWLDVHSAEQPFLLWVHFLTPHAPYNLRPQAHHLYDVDYEGPFEDGVPVRYEISSEEDLRRVHNLYDANVFYADQLFGSFLEQLRELGLMQHSLVVLTSDHGEEFMEHGNLQHGWLTEEHVRIPLVMRPPAGMDGPTRISTPVTNLDFFPSVSALVGLDPPLGTDGRNLLLAMGPPEHILGMSYTHRVERLASVRRGPHKLIIACAPELHSRLYDLSADPDEKQDLASERPELRHALERELWSTLQISGCDEFFMRRVGGQNASSPTEDLSEDTIDALRSLGYVE